MEINKIKAANIKNLKLDEGLKIKKIPDGGGLYLWLKPNNLKQWYFHYRYSGKTRDYYLGSFPILTCENARKKRDYCKRLLLEKIDPKIYFNEQKKKLVEDSEKTFKKVAQDWLSSCRIDLDSSTRKHDFYAFNKDIYPSIGDIPIKQITTQDVKKCIDKVQLRTKGDTNKRVLYRIISVFNYAVDMQLISYNPAIAVKRYLRKPLKRNMPAITHDMAKFGEFLRVLDSFKDILSPSVFYCLQLSKLVVARSGEIRKMKWKEIDFKNRLWYYYVTKIKAMHKVPLSNQAIEILNTMKNIYYSGDDDSFVFPSPSNPERMLSDGVFHMFFARSGYNNIQSQHGFRAVFMTQLLELGYSKDWIDKELSHNIADYGGAYDRATYLEQRRHIMQIWADYLDEIKQINADIDQIRRKYTQTITF